MSWILKETEDKIDQWKRMMKEYGGLTTPKYILDKILDDWKLDATRIVDLGNNANAEW